MTNFDGDTYFLLKKKGPILLGIHLQVFCAKHFLLTSSVSVILLKLLPSMTQKKPQQNMKPF